jgi:Flp pilus assembly protein CpaB
VIQLAGSPDQVLDGTLKTGDHVDILATWTMPESCGSCHVSRTIVRNVLVVKTSQELGTTDAHITSGSGSTTPVQLRLTDREAERVLWVTENGQWWLDLRPVVKARDSSQGFANSPSILRSGLQTGASS